MNAPLPTAEPALHDVELPDLQHRAGAGQPMLAARLGLFSDVKATVEVVAGHVHSTVGELLALKEGAVIALDREVDAPFDVVLGGQLIARGQLVAVGEHFGLRITEVSEMPRR
jgi:flagellar motor switch protein FliN